MKVIVLSDLNWEQHLRGVTYREVLAASLDTVMISRYASIQKYLQIVIEENAELVIIAGDVTGDGSCGHGFHHAFMLFLSILEKLKISSCFISGNHDEHIYYDQVRRYAEKLEYAHEISNTSISINGLNILGVPYETTYSKSKIKNLLATYSGRYDIVVAHAQLKRRIRLFELDSKLIVTGHYDRKLFGYQGAVFVSLDNDDKQISYAAMEMNRDDFVTAICIKNKDGSIVRFGDSSRNVAGAERNHILKVDSTSEIDLAQTETLPLGHGLYGDNKRLAYLKYLRGIQYLRLLNRLDHVKRDKTLRPTLAVTSDVVGTQITSNYKVSESLVIDYLGKRTR